MSAVAVAVSILAIWLSFRDIEWLVFRESFASANYIWIFLATGNSLVTVYILGWRWKILLTPRANLSMGSLFRLNIISQLANIIMPARMGELLRAYLASGEAKIEGGFALGTIAVERVLDFLVFLTLWLSVPALFSLTGKIPHPTFAFFLGVLGLSVLIFSLLKPDSLVWIVRKLGIPVIPPKFKEKTISFLISGLEALSALRNLGKAFSLFILTILLIFSQVLTNYLLFLAFNLYLPIWAGLVILLAIQAGNIPPSAPGKVGVFELAVFLGLSIFSVPRNEALSYAVMLHLVAFLPKIILGGIYLGGIRARKAIISI